MSYPTETGWYDFRFGGSMRGDLSVGYAPLRRIAFLVIICRMSTHNVYISTLSTKNQHNNVAPLSLIKVSGIGLHWYTEVVLDAGDHIRDHNLGLYQVVVDAQRFGTLLVGFLA